jgi:biotin synthase-related radical SAM superfamily protein
VKQPDILKKKKKVTKIGEMCSSDCALCAQQRSKVVLEFSEVQKCAKKGLDTITGPGPKNVDVCMFTRWVNIENRKKFARPCQPLRSPSSEGSSLESALALLAASALPLESSLPRIAFERQAVSFQCIGRAVEN